MKDGFVKTAAGTPDIKVADCGYNCARIKALIDKAHEQGVRVLVLPELCITGYTCQDLFLQRQLLDSAWHTLKKLAVATQQVDALIFLGLPMRHAGKLYNVAAVLNHGEILGFIPKTCIPNYNEFYEQRHFTSGSDCMDTHEVDGVEIPFGTDLLFVCDECEELTVQQRFVRIFGFHSRQVYLMHRQVLM